MKVPGTEPVVGLMIAISILSGLTDVVAGQGVVSTGLRGEAVFVAGRQFSNHGHGVGINPYWSVATPAESWEVEIGLNLSQHDFYLLCAYPIPCVPSEKQFIVGGYVAPGWRHAFGTFRSRLGGRAGGLFGEFQEGGAALLVGFDTGIEWHVGARFALDVGMSNSVIYAGPLPRLASGSVLSRTHVVRVGALFGMDRS